MTRRAVGIVELCERVILSPRGAPHVLADYLNERGWSGFRLEARALDSIVRALIDSEHVDERTLHLLACDLAQHGLPCWEAERRDDQRPHQAIATKRAYLERQVDGGTLEFARGASEAAAWSINVVGLTGRDPWSDDAVWRARRRGQRQRGPRRRRWEMAFFAAWAAAEAASLANGRTTARRVVDAASRYASWWTLLRICARRLRRLGL